MLPSANRLRRKSDFGRVYAKGRSYATDLIVMYVLRRDTPESRIGFSVSKRLGKSVARNRVRRRLREAVRRRIPAVAPGCDVVIAAKSRAGSAEFRELLAAVDRLGTKSGLIGDCRREVAPEPKNEG